MTEEEIDQLIESHPNHFDLFESLAIEDLDEPDTRLRIIRTARTIKAINKAALQGFRPLLKRIEPSAAIQSQFTVWQDKTSGQIYTACDLRDAPSGGDWEQVIDWTDYYPHSYPNPFAAYILPADLKLGERVFLQDIIEDIVGGMWNQGSRFRLDSCEAIWNGEDFEIQFDPDRDMSEIVG